MTQIHCAYKYATMPNVIASTASTPSSTTSHRNESSARKVSSIAYQSVNRLINHSLTHTDHSPSFADMAQLKSDLPTLLGVTSGIAVLAGLICMVLHLFSKNKYPRHRGHFADTHLPPPILYSSDTGRRWLLRSKRYYTFSSIKSLSLSLVLLCNCCTI